MSQNPQKPSRDSKSSVSSELKDVDLTWDDDVAPHSLELELADDDDVFDRVTAVPDIPNEVLARRLMAKAEAEDAGSSAQHHPGSPPSVQELAEKQSQGLYEPDYDEQTLKVDQEDFQERANLLHSDPGPNLSFEFTSEAPEAHRERVGGEEVDSEENRATPSEFPAGLSPSHRSNQRTIEPAELVPTERARAPTIPRTRLPTAELILDLDGPGAASSALELAENAPASERTGDSELDFDVPPARRTHEPPSTDSAQASMKDRYALGDYTGALVAAEDILARQPEHLEALHYAERCREVLTQMYSARLGSLAQTVVIAIPNDEIRWLSLDHRAGFLLSLVDGTLTIEEILDISGMSRLDALRVIFTLVDQRVITLH